MRSVPECQFLLPLLNCPSLCLRLNLGDEVMYVPNNEDGEQGTLGTKETHEYAWGGRTDGPEQDGVAYRGGDACPEAAVAHECCYNPYLRVRCPDGQFGSLSCGDPKLVRNTTFRFRHRDGQTKNIGITCNPTK